MSFNSKNDQKRDDFIKNTYKFGEICEVLNGRAYKKNELLESGKYTVLRVGNFFSSDNWYYSDLELDANKYCDNGDLLFAWSASFGPKIWDGGKVIYHYHIWKLVPSPFVDKKFLYYWLLFSRNKMLMGVHGSVMGHLTKSSFEKQKISLPDILEQKAIAHILSTLDDKIEVNNQINKTLENMAQAIFKQWFVDFEFPNEDGEPYKSSGGEMIESELGMIPKGWEVGNLAESKLTNLVKTGIAEFSGEKIYLATADVDKSNILSKSTKVTHNERPSRANMRPRENTVWFAKMKDSRKLIRVSKQSKTLIDNYIFSTGFAGINVKEGLNYIWSFICSEDFDTRKNNLCNGTTMQAINNSNISNIPLLLPNEEILKKYEDITDYLFESEYLRKKENEKLAEIRDTLLPRLMPGKIRVPLDSEGDVS